MLRSGPDRVEYNRVGQSRGHKIYFLGVLSGLGQDITGPYGVRVSKTLPRRTLAWGMDLCQIRGLKEIILCPICMVKCDQIFDLRNELFPDFETFKCNFPKIRDFRQIGS